MESLLSSGALTEYMILALPYAEINDEVRGFKRDFFKQYGAYSGQNSCAHIRLISFFQMDDREDKIISAIGDIINEIQSFEVFLNGFNLNSRHRELYIDILNKESLVDVYHSLRMRLFEELVSLSFLNPRYDPRLSVGKELSPLQFIQAAEEYKEKPYTNNFRINRLHVLKRQAPFRVWERLTELPFAKSEGELLGLC
jgi:2'-5' RNA ligase